MPSRLQRILENAVTDSTYWSSTVPQSRQLLLEMRRRGKRVNVLFRGVSDSSTQAEPEKGVPLKLSRIRGASGWSWRRLLPIPVPDRMAAAQRVTIAAGGAKLEIVCEDADWWEDEAPSDDFGSNP
jgi:hypothetical protein